MKVALLNDFWPETGIGNYAFSLFNELQKKIDVEMIYLDSSRHSLKGKGIRTIRGFSFPFLRQVLNNAIVFPQKIPQGFDVYHASNQYLSHIVVKKSVSIVSCMDVISSRLRRDYAPAVGFFWNNSTKQMARAKKIIAISHFTKQEIVKLLNIPKEKVEVIHLGFDDRAFRPFNRKSARKGLGLEESSEIILNVGSEEKRKNIATLLKAFSLVAKEKENALLLRVGEQRQETKRLIEGLGLQGKVKYLNNLSTVQLARAYNASDLLAFCSYYEGFGLPVLEAMACSTAVVATKAASIPEITGKAALLVQNPLDAEEFKQAILSVLEKPALKKSLEHKGFARARQFSWKKNAEETIKVYEEALQ